MIEYLTNYFSAFQPQSQEQFTIFVVISMIFSALSIFLGYKLTKLWSTLAGGGIGFIGGYIIGSIIWNNSGAALICAIVLALILGALAFFIYKAGVFLLCGVSVFLLTYSALSTFIDIPILTLILSIVAGIIAGVLSIILLRPFIIITTAISGSFGFAHSLFSLFPASTAVPGLPTAAATAKFLGLSWPIMLVGAVLSIIGIIVQFVSTKKHG
ncbi:MULTISPECIES: TMEM198/TM7SF3 family protein [unclassified Ruminococcus]|uniref:TMEM198/TM7SF3 family protein n=1 Tax=unclassified Ruminococcus TaxID=2608920 RepID=UPI00210BD234|nr:MULTISPECIES: TMEM198/TM7SF3 family protein [unclassified Ruminococcus]MCQ4022786.1 DUF4203 domain-containing protein [Ruminococcus sp. zg-924]MCQ4115760.1 DUF4203 domain-containing protein [Ruminococcus sp. zg-921]